MINLLIDC